MDEQRRCRRILFAFGNGKFKRITSSYYSEAVGKEIQLAVCGEFVPYPGVSNLALKTPSCYSRYRRHEFLPIHPLPNAILTSNLRKSLRHSFPVTEDGLV